MLPSEHACALKHGNGLLCAHSIPCSSRPDTVGMHQLSIICVLQEGKKGSKYTLNLGMGAAEKTTPRKATVHSPKRTPSVTQAIDFHDAENTDPFSCSQELVARR